MSGQNTIRHLIVSCTRVFWAGVLLVSLSACVHRQFVAEPYPRWGEELIGQDAPVVRALFPSDPAKARACVLLVHGMNEHIGRYDEAARYFSQQFTVAGFDLYAHGLSNPVLRQADAALVQGLGEQDVSDAYLAYAALHDLEPLRRTLGQALQQTIALCDRGNDSRRPVFIVAHSLGALVTASYLLQMQHEHTLEKRIRGVVFLGPAFAVSEPPGWRGWLANPVIKWSFHAKTHFLQPHDEPLPIMLFNQLVALVTVPLLDGLFEVLSWPGVRSILSPVSPDWIADYLTDSEAEKSKLRADGWIVRRTLLHFAKGIETEIVRFRRHMEVFDVPYYLIYSERDPITPAWGNRDFARATLHRHADNEILALPGLPYHQHLFLSDPLRAELLQRIEFWMERRIGDLTDR